MQSWHWYKAFEVPKEESRSIDKESGSVVTANTAVFEVDPGPLLYTLASGFNKNRSSQLRLLPKISDIVCNPLLDERTCCSR